MSKSMIVQRNWPKAFCLSFLSYCPCEYRINDTEKQQLCHNLYFLKILSIKSIYPNNVNFSIVKVLPSEKNKACAKIMSLNTSLLK